MGVSFSIVGAKEVKRAFRELEPKLARKVIRQAIRKGLKPVLTAARRNAPVSHPGGKTGVGRDSQGRFVSLARESGHSPGELRKSIKLRASRKRKRGVIGMTVSVSAKNPGAKFYGAFVDLGTKKIKARNFMRHAYEQNKAQAQEIARREILAGIEREAGR